MTIWILKMANNMSLELSIELLVEARGEFCGRNAHRWLVGYPIIQIKLQSQYLQFLNLMLLEIQELLEMEQK